MSPGQGNWIPHASTNIEDPECHNLFRTAKEINKIFFREPFGSCNSVVHCKRSFSNGRILNKMLLRKATCETDQKQSCSGQIADEPLVEDSDKGTSQSVNLL